MGDAMKICGICGENCAGKPRIKDPNGQYYCKHCHEEAMAKQKLLEGELTAPTRVAGPDDFIALADDESDLKPGKKAQRPAKTGAAHGAGGLTGDVCPGCGIGIAPATVVCTNCGFNFRSGGQAATTVDKG